MAEFNRTTRRVKQLEQAAQQVSPPAMLTQDMQGRLQQVKLSPGAPNEETITISRDASGRVQSVSTAGTTSETITINRDVQGRINGTSVS